MDSAKTFKDLILWQKAHKFVLEIYKETKDFPGDEKFGLVQQMRRAAVSVPANIAEGFPKKTKKEKQRFFNIAKGSLEELRYYLILSNDLNYLNTSDLTNKLEEVSKLLYSYTKTLVSSDF